MLDPRWLADRRDEIAEACRRRGAHVDLGAASAAREELARLQAELQDWNQKRNEHQAAGKRKLAPEERETREEDDELTHARACRTLRAGPLSGLAARDVAWRPTPDGDRGPRR